MHRFRRNSLSSLLSACAALVLLLVASRPLIAGADELEYQVSLETALEHDDGKFLWYHPRAAAVPGDDGPAVVMTLQQHLHVDDYYSGLFAMRRPTVDGDWSGPTAIPELAWRKEANDVTLSVADVTPGWHAPTQRLLAIGCQVPYSPNGAQIVSGLPSRQHQTAYAVHDPRTGAWSGWQILEMPADKKFELARNACAQWLVRPDGALLLPIYFGASAEGPWSVTVVECSFDGKLLRYVRHGNEFDLNVERGLVEPSIVYFCGRHFLTMRNDLRGYVSVSDDGLNFAPMKPWTFDDGKDLGSYNTQQHWLAHSDGLFLVYTRRGANNDHIIRHRAPLFMAKVDPQTLQVIRRTERIIIPERGGEFGNFGAAAISANESWITVSEGVWDAASRERGAKGATYVARIIWSKPNKLAPFPSIPLVPSP